jgi:hypothetical protein
MTTMAIVLVVQAVRLGYRARTGAGVRDPVREEPDRQHHQREGRDGAHNVIVAVIV